MNPGLTCEPQNDLDCYYNYDYKIKNKLDKNTTRINNFIQIQKNIDAELEQIVLTAIPNSNPANNLMIKLRDTYPLRQSNLQPIIDLIQKINKINSVNDLAHVLVHLTRLSISTLFDVGVDMHHTDPSVYVLYLSEMNLSLEYTDIYKNPDLTPGSDDETKLNTLASVLNSIRDFMSGTLEIIKSEFAINVLLFEFIMAQSMLSVDQRNDPKVTSNSLPMNKFIEKFDHGDFWKIILSNILIDQSSWIKFSNPAYLIFMKHLLISADQIVLELIKDYLIYCVISKYGDYMPIAPILAKLSPIPFDEKKIYQWIFIGRVGYHLESIYETWHGDADNIAQIHSIFDNIKSYCMDMWNKTSMFDSKTKKIAVQKLCRMRCMVGKQGYTINPDSMPILGNDFYNNLMIMDSFLFEFGLKFVNRPINPDCISLNNDIYSFIVNAYYDQTLNLVYIPTGIFHDKIFFDKDAAILSNYGAIGTIIGHEIMHSFDNHGAEYDADGKLHNWWTPSDYAIFKSEVKYVSDHYSQLKINGISIKSINTTGEDIADIVGLKMSLRAYMRKYKIKNKSDLKLFFKKWANNFRYVYSTEYLKYIINTDVHSPSVIRINAPLSHIAEYYEIYDVKPYHQNYLEPNLRSKFLD